MGSHLEVCGGLGLILFGAVDHRVGTLLPGLLRAFLQIRKRHPSFWEEHSSMPRRAAWEAKPGGDFHPLLAPFGQTLLCSGQPAGLQLGSGHRNGWVRIVSV